MLLRPIVLALGLTLPAAATVAEQMPAPLLVQAAAIDPAIAALSDVMQMEDIIAVMRDEGLKYGATLEEEMFPGRGGDRWEATIASIYDGAAMRRGFDTGMSRELAGDAAAIEQIAAFFGSDQGRNALQLEIAARRALLDPSAEDAAKVAWEDMLAEDHPRVAMLKRFAEANDLIESNVMGALNANLAFYKGMAATGAFPDEMTEEQMLSDVWSQEPEVRAETEDWLFPFLALAYQPMSDADLEAYTAFSETEAGQKINAALFSAFDDVFTDISFALGEAAARQMQGEDI
ncbi:hypothetical protein ACSBLW_18855 [Thioclava sp. FR2]|uniref:hypothetical protein n=1 Tax=Thioclava sp. FR2 TaxID=3445780 RepID=UPI003EBD801D